MSDTVGLQLFAATISAAILVPKAIAYLKKPLNNPHLKRISCISAPGKVLVAGGYLVLEHPNLGISVSTSSRFYTTVKPELLNDKIPSYPCCLTIVINSPQFYEQYVYFYNIETGVITGKAVGGASFVKTCVELTMGFVREFKEKDGTGLNTILNAIAGTHYFNVTLQADNDFYSQIKEVTDRLFCVLQ